MKEWKTNSEKCEKKTRRNNGGEDVTMHMASENAATKDNYLKENSENN